MNQMKAEIIVTSISKQELENLILQNSRKANSQLYKGLAGDLNTINERLQLIERELEYLKLTVQSKPRKKKEVEE
jgi:hypothetical protein